MDKVVRLPARERQALFSETAARMGTTPAVVEKDFWVTWVLSRLYQNPDLSGCLMFKGGTSLSKVYRVIERFSEDIDLILDWRVLMGDNPMAERTRTQQEKLNDQIDQQAQAYIRGYLLARITEEFKSVCSCEMAQDDPHVINVRYPAAFPDDYLRPEVRLEIGPLASWVPFEERTISCYAAEAFPQVFEQTEYAVKVIKAERTFWEKATILHHEVHRPEDIPQPLRYSRHYYDLSKMAESPIRHTALADLDQLASVVKFKQRFYPRGWARYDQAKPGTFRLVPEGPLRAVVENDYRKMENMIFGNVPAFEAIMEVLQHLQDEING